jgi:type IV fimbrial biogenesis protein FimT
MLDREKRGYVLSAFPKAMTYGFTLIELMITIAIFSITLTFGMSSYRTWVQNTQIRNVAESIQNGFQKARAEAVKRNGSVEFVLGYDPNPPHLVTNPLWKIQLPGNTSPCLPPSTTLLECANTGGAKNVTVATTPIATTPPDAMTITFNNLGMVTANANASATLAQVDLDSTVSAADLRNLTVTIGLGGNARVCDPNLSASSTDPRRCF